MELLNKTIIRIKAYNGVADYIYRKLKKGQVVVVEGKIRNDGSVNGEHFRDVHIKLDIKQ